MTIQSEVDTGIEAAGLNSLQFNQFRSLFAELTIPDPNSILGVYRAEFVGPAWLRASAGPALALSGLGGWCGKEFSAGGGAINIVKISGKFSTRFPMQLVTARSFIDQKEGLSLHYLPGSPFPWMYVVDELRRLDEISLLGMTIANVAGLRGLAFPFLLQKTQIAGR